MILVTGATGFLGRWVTRLLGDVALPLPGRSLYDLRLPSAMHDALADHPGAEAVIHLAYPGTEGITTMVSQPADLVHQMLQIDMHVIHACARMKVPRLVTMGSVCSYPAQVTHYPTPESELWNGYPEATNAAYGTAKRMQLELLRSYRRQYGLRSIQLVLDNLYGPGDRSGHVIPALIRRALEAGAAGGPLIVWGRGGVSREFVYVEDAARAAVLAATVGLTFSPVSPVNICSGEEIRMDALVRRLTGVLRFEGPIVWDPSKPEGQVRRCFSPARALRTLGWAPQVPVDQGLALTVAWWRAGCPPAPPTPPYPSAGHRAAPGGGPAGPQRSPEPGGGGTT